MTSKRTAHPTLVAGGSVAVSLNDVFVAIDLVRDVTYVAYEAPTGIRWDELSLADGEVLARLGARAELHLS